MPTYSSHLIGASRLNWNEWDYRKACIKINQTWGVQARNKYCPQWVNQFSETTYELPVFSATQWFNVDEFSTKLGKKSCLIIISLCGCWL